MTSNMQLASWLQTDCAVETHKDGHHLLLSPCRPPTLGRHCLMSWEDLPQHRNPAFPLQPGSITVGRPHSDDQYSTEQLKCCEDVDPLNGHIDHVRSWPMPRCWKVHAETIDITNLNKS